MRLRCCLSAEQAARVTLHSAYKQGTLMPGWPTTVKAGMGAIFVND